MTLRLHRTTTSSQGATAPPSQQIQLFPPQTPEEEQAAKFTRCLQDLDSFGMQSVANLATIKREEYAEELERAERETSGNKGKMKHSHIRTAVEIGQQNPKIKTLNTIIQRLVNGRSRELKERETERTKASYISQFATSVWELLFGKTRTPSQEKLYQLRDKMNQVLQRHGYDTHGHPVSPANNS